MDWVLVSEVDLAGVVEDVAVLLLDLVATGGEFAVDRTHGAAGPVRGRDGTLAAMDRVL